MLDVSESAALFWLGGPCPPTVGVAFRNRRPHNKIAHTENCADLPRDMPIVFDERTLLGNSHLPGSHADNNSFHLAYPAVRPRTVDPAIELEGLTLDETLVVSHQNVLDQVRVVEEIDVTGKSAIVEDVTLLTSPLRIQCERVSASQREVSDDPAIPRTGRTNQRHHKLVANTSLADLE